MPLVDPDKDIGEDRQVYAWVMPTAPLPRGSSPQPWLDTLARQLDGKPLALVAVGHAGYPTTRERGYPEAITDAERRYGLRSHPEAPIFRFPEPENPFARP